MALRHIVLVILLINTAVFIAGTVTVLPAADPRPFAAGMMALSGFVMMVVSFFLYGLYEKREKNAQKHMEALTAGLTHDFNNLLSPVESYATFLCEDLPPQSESYGFADKIITALPQMRRVLEQVRQDPYCYGKKKKAGEAGKTVAALCSNFNRGAFQGCALQTTMQK